jgi:hypothetical protein
MALTWIEDNGSRGATIARLGRKAQSVYRRSYKLFGSSDDIFVHDQINQTLTAGGLFWQYPGAGDQVLQAESYTLEYLGDDAWHLEVNYVKEGGADNPDEPDPLRRSRSFDTGGATTHITQAQGDPPERRYGVNAPDQKGAIGVDNDSVQGVDIVIPNLTWTETYDVPSTYVTTDYVKNLSRITGTVNDAAFRGFAAREVLFLGASGSQDWDEKKGDGPWTLSFKFVANANAGSGATIPPLTVGSIGNIQKDGHEYLWVRYEDNVENDSLIKEPKHVYVNKVYRDEDFSQLGIGGVPPSPTSAAPTTSSPAESPQLQS